MRAVALAILATSLSQAAALAADFDPGPLRGTEYVEPAVAPVVSWEGPYFGGFGGYAQTNFEFGGVFRDPVGHILRNLTIEQEFGLSKLLAAKSDDARSTAYGGFAGYNTQFEDVVLGVELDYTHARMKGVSADSIGRSMVTSDGYFNSVHLSGLASANLNDYGSLRARIGYVTGPFMPFVMGRIALGRFDS